MKKQNTTCLIGRAVAAKLWEGNGLWKGGWGCCGPAPRWLHGCPAARGACGWTAGAQCHWDSAGKVCLASPGSKAFISVCSNPCTLQPARHHWPLFQKSLLFARELRWVLCRFGSVRKTNFAHLRSVSVILRLAQLLILPLLLASRCKWSNCSMSSWSPLCSPLPVNEMALPCI